MGRPSTQEIVFKLETLRDSAKAHKMYNVERKMSLRLEKYKKKVKK